MNVIFYKQLTRGFVYIFPVPVGIKYTEAFKDGMHILFKANPINKSYPNNKLHAMYFCFSTPTWCWWAYRFQGPPLNTFLHLNVRLFLDFSVIELSILPIFKDNKKYLVKLLRPDSNTSSQS